MIIMLAAAERCLAVLEEAFAIASEGHSVKHRIIIRIVGRGRVCQRRIWSLRRGR